MSLSTLGLARIVCSKANALTYAADADAACMLCLVELGEDIITPVLTGHLKLQHARSDIKRYTSLWYEYRCEYGTLNAKTWQEFNGCVYHMVAKRRDCGEVHDLQIHAFHA